MSNAFVPRTFKYVLNRIGRNLSKQTLIQLQAVVDYLKIGQWMRQRNFEFPSRVNNKEEVWSTILPRLLSGRVLYLEFGVAAGGSMRWWSSHLENPNSDLHGFDSFEGLAEEDGPWTKGMFSTEGRIPIINDTRVKFFKGWFTHTLPAYSVPAHDTLVVNLDADLYSSTIYVLRWLRPYLKPGTFIYFDEMNYFEHEPKAFDEFVEETGLVVKPVAAHVTLAHVMFEVVESVHMDPVVSNY